MGVAIAGWLAALRLRHVPAADPQAPPPVNALASTGRDLGELFGSRKLLATAAGIVFFWALAAIAQLNVDQFAFESGATSQTQIVPLLVALVGGIGLGSLLAGKLSRRGIDEGSAVDLGFVPLGGLVMTIGCFALALCGTGIFPADAASGGFPGRSSHPSSGWWCSASVPACSTCRSKPICRSRARRPAGARSSPRSTCSCSPACSWPR